MKATIQELTAEGAFLKFVIFRQRVVTCRVMRTRRKR